MAVPPPFDGRREGRSWVQTSLAYAAAALIAIVFALVLSAPAKAGAGLWAKLAEGRHVALMRHALAPGTGDPAGFALDRCETQRNLNATGRAQAKAIGAAFRARGLAGAAVYSSQWCRCLETARLLGLGGVEPMAALNSFFGDRSAEPAQTAAVKRFLTQRSGTKPAVLVTHQVNITTLTGVFPASGEIIVIRVERDGRVVVAGRIAPPG